MSAERRDSLRGKRILLLQGPVGPFFRRLSHLLHAAGAEVHKVNFNGGDCLFYPSQALHWRGPMESWPYHFAALLERLRIDIVLLFGDCRPIHRAARDVAQQLGIKVGAFEEGYVRPNFITFERFGVNGNSQVPRQRDFYDALAREPGLPERDLGNTFWWAALWAVLYYTASSLAQMRFPRYQHHRPLALREVWPWLRAGGRKLLYKWTERRALRTLTGSRSRKFFLVPLQLSSDSQVSEHSRFASVADFIRHVIASFARHAAQDLMLVIKHHPLDRGYHDYAPLIRQLAQEHRLGARLLYTHDQYLPALFDHMRGAVVINSTVGFSALTHGAPLKTLGVAVYDMEGLTFQGPLDEFWSAAAHFRPDFELLHRFRTYLIHQTQINGSFYKVDTTTAAAAMVSVADALGASQRQRAAALTKAPSRAAAGSLRHTPVPASAIDADERLRT
jgi:capsular polysaccharide export protein